MVVAALDLHNDDMAIDGTTSQSAVGESFDEVVLPHLDAGRRLAHWLMRNEHDADDVVQEASLRAFRYFQTFTGGSGRAWFLQIVRNTCNGRRNRYVSALDESFDEELHSDTRPALDPEMLTLQRADRRSIERAVNDLPARFRQLFVLREMDGLSYRQLADVMDLPLGTVMSCLSRARRAVASLTIAEIAAHCGTPALVHCSDVEDHIFAISAASNRDSGRSSNWMPSSVAQSVRRA